MVSIENKEGRQQQEQSRRALVVQEGNKKESEFGASPDIHKMCTNTIVIENGPTMLRAT